MSDTLFILSKVFAVLLEPDAFCLLALTAAVLVLWLKPRLGRWLVSAVTLLLLILSILPVGAWLLEPLEERFPQPNIEAMTEPDGIIVLGGAVQPAIALARGTLALNRHGERITTLVMLARRFPTARLVFSGGSADVRGENPTEAAIIAPYLTKLGIEPNRVLLEATSRNTYENALETKRLVQPNRGESWLLVTSAAHMPRSVGVFRGAGWEVVAFPADYQTSGSERWPVLAPASHWQQLRLAVHEYIGLLSYYLAGYSHRLFPGPQEKT